jgi:hypothetical protein
MLLSLGIVLALIWILSFVVYHVTSAAIHVLLLLAVLSVLVHFIRPRHRPARS